MSRFVAVVIVAILFGSGFAQTLLESPPEEKAPPEVGNENTAGDGPSELEAKREREEYYKLLMVLADTIDQIDRNYVENVSRRELVEAAIEGAVRKLDPYSNYIAPEEMDGFKTEVENQFGGIGIQISMERGQLKVISPLVGTPAYRAGVMAGDLILAIDGVPTKGMSIDDAIKRMKGKVRTDVSLSLFHPFSGESEDVQLTRDVIKVQTVLGDQRTADDEWDFMYDEAAKIGYIRVTTFGRETKDELTSALKTLNEQGLQGLVLDLRFNPGGLLKSAIQVSDLFLSSGTIVGTEGRNIRSQTWTASAGSTMTNVPMVVLVNQFSASASEIVAAALQDHDRAIVIGQQTFGKASLQNVVELEGGKSAIKLTTGSYQRPSGRPIHRFAGAKEWGVEPDEGYSVVLKSPEIGRLMAQRRDRDIVRSGQNADDEPRSYVDRQLEQGLGYLREELSKSE